MRKFVFGILLSVLMCCLPFVANAVTCPDGYSVIDDSGLCKVQCPAGYRVENVGDVCTQITGTSPYYSAKHIVVYGETSGDNVKKCPEPDPSIIYAVSYGVLIPSSLDHSSINQCILYGLRVRYTTEEGYSPAQISHGVLNAPCYYTTGDDGHAIYDKQTKDPVTGESRTGCVGGTTVRSCDAGYYAHCTLVGTSTPNEMPCQPVGYNYYSPDGDLTRYPCPVGTMTCGYGDCADGVEDCVPYKTLHVGNDVSLVMATEKYMSPSLAIMGDDNVVYYAQTTNKKIPGMHVRLLGADNIEYTVINPLEQFGTTVRKYSASYAQYCENGETTYTHIDIP